MLQYTLGFSVDQAYQTMELVNECSPTEKFKKADKTFMIDPTYEKELMAALPLSVNYDSEGRNGIS